MISCKPINTSNSTCQSKEEAVGIVYNKLQGVVTAVDYLPEDQISEDDFDMDVPNEYIYFADDENLPKDVQNGIIKKCPCKSFPLILSNVRLNYQPDTHKPPKTKEEDKKFPIPNEYYVDISRWNEDNGRFTKSCFDPISLSPKQKKESQDDPVIAIIDSGVDTNIFEPTLYLWQSEKDAYTDNYSIIGGINLVPPNGYADTHVMTLDDIYRPPHEQNDSHGTIITDIINSYKPEGYRTMVIRAFDCQGVSTLFDIMCALYYAKENGAEYINASWGFYTLDETMGEPFERFIDDSPNINLYTSIGNEGINIDHVYHFPSNLAKSNSQVSTTMAIDRGPNFNLHSIKNQNLYNASLADFSNWSESMAPYTLSARANGMKRYNGKKGTSFAAPQTLAFDFINDKNETGLIIKWKDKKSDDKCKSWKVPQK